VGQLGASDFQALGVYDPGAPHAAEKLELLEYLVSLGASADDLAANRDELPSLATIVAIRGGEPMTLAEAARSAGVSEDTILRINQATGLPTPDPEARVFGPQIAGLAGRLAAAETVFGEDVVLQLVRVMGSAMARLADALVSAFLANVEPSVPDDPVGMGIARANASASALLPILEEALDGLLRQHILAARRPITDETAAAGYESRPLCVGFVDLVGSTALAQRLSTGELGSVLGEFERLAADAVRDAGGRVVKLIGDEIMYTAGEESTACQIALALASRFDAHPVIPTVRAGLAGGSVLMRDGDVFGPVVNLAARVVKVAAPGEVVAPAELAEVAGMDSQPLGPQALKGFEGEVELCRLTPLAPVG
jgi:class 3 adenylate cyclase